MKWHKNLPEIANNMEKVIFEYTFMPSFSLEFKSIDLKNIPASPKKPKAIGYSKIACIGENI